MASIVQKLANLNNWSAPGPKALGWYEDWSPMPFIMGPVAGGKTWTACMKCLEVARLQHPNPNDGWRRARMVCVRQNYRRLHDSILPSWHKLFPRDTPHWEYHYNKDGPVDHKIRLNDEKLGKIELWVSFRAFGDQDIDSFVRGLETTGFWLNETDEMPPHSLGQFYKRTGRYPAPEDRPVGVKPAWRGVFGDFNAPDEDSWVYEDLFLKPLNGVRVYIQPGGMRPDAENLHNLRKIDPDYYENMASKMQPWEVKRFIDNKIGMSRAGKPVYPEFDDEFHVAKNPLMPERHRPLTVAIDPGGRAAAIIGQKQSSGALVRFRELATPDGEFWTPEEIARRIAEILVQPPFDDFLSEDLLRFAPDPTYANQRSGKANSDQTWLHHFIIAMKDQIGICPIKMPHTNALSARVGAVRSYFITPDSHPRALFDPSMIATRRAYNGAYCFIKTMGKDGHYKVEPDKGPPSDLADADQYLALVEAGPVRGAAPLQVIEGRRRDRGLPRSQSNSRRVGVAL